MAISENKWEFEPAQGQAMTEYTLQNMTRGCVGCGTYTFTRTLYEEMMELELTRACGFNGDM